ncbi:hypothetical protein DDI_1473 [Dickeya dianthicola RNS04.9]|nr:hypothetical protein DDI_1473 [Dickeya dianthicola RNS04.9]
MAISQFTQQWIDIVFSHFSQPYLKINRIKFIPVGAERK